VAELEQLYEETKGVLRESFPRDSYFDNSHTATHGVRLALAVADCPSLLEDAKATAFHWLNQLRGSLGAGFISPENERQAALALFELQHSANGKFGGALEWGQLRAAVHEAKDGGTFDLIVLSRTPELLVHWDRMNPQNAGVAFEALRLFCSREPATFTWWHLRSLILAAVHCELPFPVADLIKDKGCQWAMAQPLRLGENLRKQWSLACRVLRGEPAVGHPAEFCGTWYLQTNHGQA
jgi:hypothetical protein